MNGKIYPSSEYKLMTPNVHDQNILGQTVKPTVNKYVLNMAEIHGCIIKVHCQKLVLSITLASATSSS